MDTKSRSLRDLELVHGAARGGCRRRLPRRAQFWKEADEAIVLNMEASA
jgi:hypothetical protein